MDVTALLKDFDEQVENAVINLNAARAKRDERWETDAKREWKTWKAARSLVRKAAGIDDPPDKNPPR